MFASSCSLFGKLVSSRTAFRCFWALKSFHSFSVGPVSPLIPSELPAVGDHEAARLDRMGDRHGLHRVAPDLEASRRRGSS